MSMSEGTLERIGAPIIWPSGALRLSPWNYHQGTPESRHRGSDIFSSLLRRSNVSLNKVQSRLPHPATAAIGLRKGLGRKSVGYLDIWSRVFTLTHLTNLAQLHIIMTLSTHLRLSVDADTS